MSPQDLAPLGISLVESAASWLRGIGLRAGFVPLAWDHDRRPGLVWRIPDKDMPAASLFSRIQGVLVREYERALVIHNGKFYAELESGVYDIRKMPIKDLVDIIWVSTEVTQHKWGLGRAMNKENITIGAHGYIFLQVADARNFVLSVVAGNRTYTPQDMEDWIFGVVSGFMRTQVAASTISDLMQAQEEFVRACTNRLTEVFGEWGIAFKNLVVNQFDVPQEYRDAAARVALAKFRATEKVVDAEASAEALRIQSHAEAAARLTTGSAEVELLTRMQAFGLDPIRLKAIEALTQYAQLAAKTGSGDDSGSDMVKMMLFMQMSRLLTDPGMPGEAKDLLRAQFPGEAARVAQIQAPPQSPSGAPPQEPAVDERTRIQRTLDNLDERLASGEISESTYNTLRARWEAKLADLGKED